MRTMKRKIPKSYLIQKFSRITNNNPRKFFNLINIKILEFKSLKLVESSIIIQYIEYDGTHIDLILQDSLFLRLCNKL